MKKTILLALLSLGVGATGLQAALPAIDDGKVQVTLKNADKTLNYEGALVVSGQKVTLKNKTLIANDSNQIAVLVVNGGELVLDHCHIIKTGDGKLTAQAGGMMGNAMNNKKGGRPQGGMRPGGGQGGPGMPPGGMGNGKRPEGNPPSGGKPGQGGPGGMGGGMGDDSFNFYGLNSAIVAVGKKSSITLIGCEVETNAEYANAVFACDGATIDITEGINIQTQKGSSRGLYATCGGIIKADGVINITTQGAHCATLATDRGGGTVVLGKPGTPFHSILHTAGEGSPCIYSTGDIYAYNAEGEAEVSQTMVVEGKNSITVEDCQFTGNSPKHGGIMLYQSTSGDADEGTSLLDMKHCSIRDNSGTSMFLITNTHSVVNIEDCTLLNAHGEPFTSNDALIVCRNCNNDGHRWGQPGSNGGQVEISLKNQQLQGSILANETESSITITSNKGSDVSELKTLEGNGTVKIRK